MSSPDATLTRMASLKSAAEFKQRLSVLGLDLPCDESVLNHDASPLARPLEIRINNKIIGNRFAIQPMEGWDASIDGKPSEPMRRRWRRFGESGAKLVWGGEAMAVTPKGRANSNQLVIGHSSVGDLADLKRTLVDAHERVFGTSSDLVVGFQLTHSGRFCKPHEKFRWESRIAYRHPLLDRRFGIDSDSAVLSDLEMDEIILSFIEAAGTARDAGADFIDLKHCHGYLLHEFLSARNRPGKFGGSFENRTRPLREIVQGIRSAGNSIEIGVRLSAFDFVPFRPDPLRSTPGKPGPGVPEDFSGLLPYGFGFGTDARNPTQHDLHEPIQFLKLCESLGIRLVNVTAGSPYYNPHIQRPAAYPPSDGYQPPNDPLVDVHRQMDVTRQLKQAFPRLVFVGSAYSYFQEFLVPVAQGAVRENWVDLVGLGRMALSYPDLAADSLQGKRMEKKKICRTFSDCTTAPRQGLPSGCYPLDPYYTTSPEHQELKKRKNPKN